MRVIALIDDPIVLREILTHLGRWQPEAQECAPPVAPETWPAHTSTTPKSAPEVAFDGRRAGFPRRFLTAWGGRGGSICLSLAGTIIRATLEHLATMLYICTGEIIKSILGILPKNRHGIRSASSALEWTHRLLRYP
jgi:hypothetical protein